MVKIAIFGLLFWLSCSMPQLMSTPTPWLTIQAETPTPIATAISIAEPTINIMPNASPTPIPTAKPTATPVPLRAHNYIRIARLGLVAELDAEVAVNRGRPLGYPKVWAFYGQPPPGPLWLAGHKPGPFSILPGVIIGDRIVVNWWGTDWTYIVRESFILTGWPDVDGIWAIKQEWMQSPRRLYLQTCEDGVPNGRLRIVLAELA